jgi:hypothetical protein
MAVKFPEGTNLDRVANTLGGGGAQPNQQLVGLDAGQRAVPHSFGPYREAVPNPSVSPAAVFTVDRESQERALAGHARIQNSLADFIRSYGLAPVSPRRGGPDFDIGSEGVGFTVAEIKSLNGANVGRQLRIGLGQVLQYRTMLTATNIAAGAVLAVEHPVDDLWVEVCSSVGVVLTWPPDWPRLGRVLGNSAHD